MNYVTQTAAALAALVFAASAHAQTAQPFSIASADGVMVHGQVDVGPRADAVAILVAGTGLFDRDAAFGASDSPRDKVFADLAARINARGLSVIRYDRRGVIYGATGAARLDAALAATVSNETQRDDLAAIYAYARDHLRARCVVLFGHSEGMVHIGRLAAAGAPAPRLVVGVGPLLESPLSVLRWQLVERATDSLILMDADGDGVITNEEVQANWRTTPIAVYNTVEPLLHPSGAWTAERIAEITTLLVAQYDTARDTALAPPDDTPYPNAQMPMARQSWWKSWFTDDVSIAQHLAAWNTPMIFHLGDRDSQTSAARQQAAAQPIANRARFVLHPGLGHTLSPHVLLGPIDEPVADRLAEDIAGGCA